MYHVPSIFKILSSTQTLAQKYSREFIDHKNNNTVCLITRSLTRDTNCFQDVTCSIKSWVLLELRPENTWFSSLQPTPCIDGRVVKFLTKKAFARISVIYSIMKECEYVYNLPNFIHTYIHTYMHTYMHTYIRTTYNHTYNIHIITRTYLRTYTYACIHDAIHTIMYAYRHTYILRYIHTYTHTCIYTYIYMHAYIHTYMHAYVRTYIKCVECVVK